MLTRWQGSFGAAFVACATVALVILDLANGGFRRWWDGHALTTDTVAGMLVLLITVLVVDQVMKTRQERDRSRAVAAQATMVMGQAVRASKSLSAATSGSGDRSAASDEVRTYMIMLLVGAPVLIDAKVSRTFLEQAQQLGGEMARCLAAMATAPAGTSVSSARLDASVKRLKAAFTPALQPPDPELVRAATGDDSE